ncbi:MAG: ABC-type transport auxiliary lipoprotein family protein [Pseudomonas sp.]|nr:ABC-type transport auxiliary lipoprotein family protein [Pseudomonas sp.]
MKQLTRLPRAIAMLGVLAVGAVGCSVAPHTNFYQLQQPATEVVEDKNTATVLLGPLTVADYLQRESIVQREADGSLSLSQEARWAGSLSDDMGQLLLRQVSRKLGSSRISLYPDRIGMIAQVQIVLSISRLDSGVEQPAVLEAQWRLLDEKGSVQNSRVVRLEAEHTGDMQDQVRAQSELLVQLSEQLVQMVKQALPAAVTQKTPSQTSTETAGKKSSKKLLVPLDIPVVEPVREHEVYRF